MRPRPSSSCRARWTVSGRSDDLLVRWWKHEPTKSAPLLGGGWGGGRMTDDLGLGLSAPEAERRPSYRRRRIVVALVMLAVIGVVVAAALVGARIFNGVFGAPDDYSGSGTGHVQLRVPQGDSIPAMGETLETRAVVKGADACVEAASAGEGAGSIGPGFYTLREHMKPSLALSLRLVPASLVQSRVVVPE